MYNYNKMIVVNQLFTKPTLNIISQHVHYEQLITSTQHCSSVHYCGHKLYIFLNFLNK